MNQIPELIFRKTNFVAAKHIKIFSFPENSISEKWNIFRKCFYMNQTQHKCAFGFSLKSQLILLFSLFLLLFIDPTALFGTIHRSHCTIQLRVHLGTVYFAETKKLLLKVL